MFNKSYLSSYTDSLKKSVDLSSFKTSKMPEVNMNDIAESLIQQQNNRTKQLEMQMRQYQVQIEAEKSCRTDHGPYIEALQKQTNQIKIEQVKISQQIRNCQLVDGQVTPMQYYLWKKKQRINTYDASIAELCKQIEVEREWMEKTTEQLHNQSQILSQEVEQLEDRLTQMNTSSPQFYAPNRLSEEVDSYEQLFAANIELKQEYSNLQSTHQFLQENKDIVAMQISDNIKSIESTLKAYFDSQKIKLVKEFKQIQNQSKNMEVSTLNVEEQNYKIDPLLNDYAYKLKQIHGTVPENMKKVVHGILQPLTWQKFYWRDFLEIQPKSEQIYAQHRKLEGQYMQNESTIQKLKQKIKQLSDLLVIEQIKSTDVSENIHKLRKKLKK